MYSVPHDLYKKVKILLQLIYSLLRVRPEPDLISSNRSHLQLIYIIYILLTQLIVPFHQSVVRLVRTTERSDDVAKGVPSCEADQTSLYLSVVVRSVQA